MTLACALQYFALFCKPLTLRCMPYLLSCPLHNFRVSALSARPAALLTVFPRSALQAALS